MRNWRTMVGTLCIVLAMVLGVFAGFVYARDAGIVGVSPTVGARGEDQRLVSALNPTELLTPEQADAMLEAQEMAKQTSLLGSDLAQPAVPDDAARAVTTEERREVLKSAVTVQADDGSLTVTPSTPGTRYSGAGVDFGGPYGGPDVLEGSDITFTVTPNDPTILFYRYDLTGDGKFDYPDQTGCGSLGCWTTESSVTRRFNDNFYATITVQGWDGVSTTITINSGDNLNQPTSPYWYVFPKNSGHKFTPKSDLSISQLGAYQWFNQGAYGYQLRIWRVSPPAFLGGCTPPDLTFQWNWCTLATPITVLTGVEYIIAEHKTVDYYPYWMGILGPPGTQPAKVTIGNFFYTWSTNYAFPSTDGGPSVIMMTDFRWTETLILADAASDGALLDVNNVAPLVSDVVTNPSPALEGTPTQFMADFSDPGIDDTWEYRWIFHDGEVSDWFPVSKWSGGARVLVLHTFAGDGNTLRNQVATRCGNFCTAIDTLDWGPTGENRIPALDELTPYDVVVMGTNYFHYMGDAMGDLLADYMDAAGSVGGGVVMMQGGLDNAFGCDAGICGRWDNDEYSPVPRGYIYGASGSMGAIYVPGHPLLDGVSSVSTLGLAGEIYTINSGATRVVDWNNGRVLGAVRTNPVIGNGARSVALNFFPILGYTGGDYYQMIANAIRWASRQPDPVLKSMPITLDPLTKTYRDDNPTTTTPVDSFPVRVEVRDDDHLKVKIQSATQLYFNNFESTSQCNGQYYTTTIWPPGWSSSPNPYGWTCNFVSTFGSRGPNIWYYYNDPLYGTGNGNSYLNTNLFDLSAFVGVQFDYYTYWQADYPSGNQNGFVQASLDGGATWPVTIHEMHHNNPASFQGTISVQNTLVGGDSNVRFRFYYQSQDDWWWFVDNVRITGLVGDIIQGLGTADGVASVANVPPTVSGGFDDALRSEAQGLEFSGFEVSDPAILEPTEWFAYRIDLDDGTPSDWVYKGTLAPPKFDILIVHTICLGTTYATCNAGGSGQLQPLLDMLSTLDDVGTVDTWNFINYPFTPSAPPLSLMMNYDVIIVATNWAYFSYQPFNLARTQVGDRLADYLDSGRGGAFTMMCVYCTSGGNDLFSIRGRFMDEDYGPFERANYIFPGASAIMILDPSHDLFVKVGPNVGSSFIHDGNLPTTPGGVLLAEWTHESHDAVGAKTLANGMNIAHFGGWHAPPGSDSPMLFRNAIGFAAGGLPSPKIPPFTHTYGDNGIYNVDFAAIDDDMGFVWDFAANQPVEAMPGVAISHRTVTVAVDNVEPTITPNSLEAFIAALACVRISGQAGNSVTANFYTDGLLSASTTVTRMSGSPNPTDEKCGLLKVDVTAPHVFEATLTYSQPNGGSNPTWLVLAPWRDPISPGHGTITYKIDFATAGTFNQPLPNLKADLLSGGQGAKIDFVAEASDVGTDDLAFLWVFGNTFLDPYAQNCPVCTYAIHVHHNDGSGRTEGTLATPQFLGFGEPYFDRAANTGRSPAGTMDFQVRDTAVHAFDASQSVYYVLLVVLDDDNTRGYPTTFAPNDGVDIQYIVVDLT